MRGDKTERVHLTDKPLKKGQRFKAKGVRFKVICVRPNGKMTARRESDGKSLSFWTDQMGYGEVIK